MGPQNGKTGKGDCADVKTVPPLPGAGERVDKDLLRIPWGVRGRAGQEPDPGTASTTSGQASTQLPSPQSQELLSQPLDLPNDALLRPPTPGSLLSDLKAAPGFGRRHPPQQEGEMSFSKPSQLRNIGADNTTLTHRLSGHRITKSACPSKARGIGLSLHGPGVWSSGWNLYRGRFQLHIAELSYS